MVGPEGSPCYEGYSYLLELLWWVGFITSLLLLSLFGVAIATIEPSSYLPPPLPQFCRKQQQQPLALLAQDVRVVVLDADMIIHGPIAPWELTAEKGKAYCSVCREYYCYYFSPSSDEHCFAIAFCILIFLSV
ncbi:hypothetical protein ACFX13_043671 [Malus domestica]